MTWLARKSHRSSAPPNEQGRNGARPYHSPGAAVPHAGPAVVGPPEGTAEGTPAADPPETGPAETGQNGDPQDQDPHGPQDQDPQDTPGRESALRSGAQNTAFRAATRSTWPGTEDRHAEAAPSTSQPAQGAPAGPGVSSFGPLGAALLPDAGQPDRTFERDARIWEPRRLYQRPLLRSRRRPDAGAPDRPEQQGPEQQRPERPRPEPGTGPGQARSEQTGAPERQRPDAAAAQAGARPQPAGTAPPERRDVPVQRPAITVGSGPAPGSRPSGSLGPGGSLGPLGPSGPGGPVPADRERKADRLRLADVMADSRMRIWKRRLLVAIVAGLVFTVIFTWRAGLTAAVLAAIADAIYRSRTTASMPPGVRLTGAQKRTQRQLARMERSGYRALHSRPIPGSREFIDHFVVGPTGAYAIDSESWDKRLPIRTRNGRQLFHGPFTKKDRLEHARWEAQQATDRLTSELGTPVYVRPVLAVYGPKVPWHVATIREVDVFDGDRLRKYLRRNSGMNDRPRLSASEIERIYAAAARVLPLNDAAQRTPVG